MNASDLQVFKVVAHEGGMTKAAQVLNTVQSNITARIRILEEELGVPLFYRDKKGVRLTSAGERLIPYAEKIHDLLAEAKEIVAQTDTPQGALRIGSPETTAALRLSNILSDYGKKHHDVDLSLITGTTEFLIENVLARNLEGAFVSGGVDDPLLASFPVFEEEMVFYMPKTAKDPFSFLRNQKAKVYVFCTGCSYRRRLEKILIEHNITQVKVMEMGSFDGILACVGAGLGITLLPKAFSEEKTWKARWSHNIAVYGLKKSAAIVPTYFIRRKDTFLSPALKSFMEIIS
ncbi:LysR family transcriptional regulator [uncultured Bdellovibrio sp.]|uniref:LysR family transcriptional regulator n=1 Tax=Bdellovibrio sp. HCB-162 TaxID=3394234 RepID=UPI0026010C0B|nr:LysR family transcriptional regulator [uncultured Bdellovibrio sp.]